jgi:hypothetical protein
MYRFFAARCYDLARTVSNVDDRSALEAMAQATSNIAIANTAFDAAEKQFDGEHLTLRKGAMVRRESRPR